MKKYFLLFLLLCPYFSFAGIVSLDIGSQYDFLDYNGDQKHSAFTFPSLGISISGKEPGWHLRLKIHTNYRDFRIRIPAGFTKDFSSTTRGFLGLEWIFENNLFINAGIQYRISQVKTKVNGLDYWYDYFIFKRVSIPVGGGFIFYPNSIFSFRIEIEADLIPIVSLYERKINSTGRYWYNEYGLGLYTSFGLVY